MIGFASVTGLQVHKRPLSCLPDLPEQTTFNFILLLNHKQCDQLSRQMSNAGLGCSNHLEECSFATLILRVAPIQVRAACNSLLVPAENFARPPSLGYVIV